MKRRSIPVMVVLLVVTFGIYWLAWSEKTKFEMNKAFDTKLPTAILLIVPIVNIWWLWKWSAAAEKASAGTITQVPAFILMLLLPWIGMFIIQSRFNAQIDQGGLPMARAVA